jgi:hypothetical protein
MHVGKALAMSGDAEDRKLAGAIAAFIKDMPVGQAAAPRRDAPEVAPRAGRETEVVAALARGGPSR